jgi:hypothetical protein
LGTGIGWATVIASLVSVGWSFAACGGSSGGNGSGNDGGSGGASSGNASSSGASSAGASGGNASSDGGAFPDAASAASEQVCSSACSALIGCGVTYPSTCATDCLANTVFIACAGPAGQDCNALALCAFKQSASTSCPGGGGVPAGTSTCDKLRSCNAACFSSTDAKACACACDAALSPDKALDALVDDTCAKGMCASDCSDTGTAAACRTCEDAHCASQVARCTSN